MSRADHLWLTMRADYAVRALVELARAGGPLTTEVMADAQHIPKTFLAVIMGQLRRAGLVSSLRGRSGGYALARSPEAITIADIVQAVDGDLEDRAATEAGAPDTSSLGDAYRAVRDSMLGVLDTVSVGSLVRGRVPAHVRRLAEKHSAAVAPVTRTRKPR